MRSIGRIPDRDEFTEAIRTHYLGAPAVRHGDEQDCDGWVDHQRHDLGRCHRACDRHRRHCPVRLRRPAGL